MGYSIHSPYLFYIARFILPETIPYYCFAPLEQWRARWLSDKKEVFVKDYGTGQSGKKHVCDIAARSLKPRREAQLLLRLAVMLEAREIVELGTSLGLTTAYLAHTHSRAHVTTFEGASELLALAEGAWKKLHLRNIEAVSGNIDDTLPAWVEKRPKGAKPLDLLFVDANHTSEATLRYFRLLQPLAYEKTIFVFDDIHASADMQQAWDTIRHTQGVTASFDLYSMGLVFFDPHLERRTYRIRF